MFSYAKFENLLKKNSTTPYKVSKGTKVATSTLTAWKHGKYIPKIDKIQKIAAFLNEPIEYFLNSENTEKDTIS